MHIEDKRLGTDDHNIGPLNMGTHNYVDAAMHAYDIPSSVDIWLEKDGVEQRSRNDGDPTGDIGEVITSDIPLEVTREILLRVPAMSLLCFRAVCKAWCHMIDDPSFIKSHTNNTQLTSTSILVRKDEGGGLLYMSWDSLRPDICNDFSYESQYYTIDAIPVKSLVRRGIPRMPRLPAASCNGLFLLWHENHNRNWAIWNPLTREFHELPQANAAGLRLAGCGIGYDSVSDDYKVVRIDLLQVQGGRNFVYQTLVYSLKLDSWQMIEGCPSDLWCHTEGVFVKGALHWNTKDYIVSLDLATEEYRQLPRPPLSTYQTKFYAREYFNALGGFLALTYSCPRILSVGWVLADNGAWTELFNLKNDFMFDELLQPIVYWKDKGQVLFQSTQKFICLDIVKHSSRTVCFTSDNEFCFTSQYFSGSLFQLGSRVGLIVPAKRKDGVKRKRITEDDRWQLSVLVCDSSDWENEDEYEDDLEI